MAVRLLTRGPDPAVVKYITCNNCGATLSYVPNDVHRYDGTDYSGGPDGHEWVDCPACSKKVIIRSW